MQALDHMISSLPYLSRLLVLGIWWEFLTLIVAIVYLYVPNGDVRKRSISGLQGFLIGFGVQIVIAAALIYLGM